MTDWKKLRAVLTLCAALGWWGVWFPELAVWADIVCVAEEEDAGLSVQQEDAKLSVQAGENVIECETAREIYGDLLHADRDQIQLKSRLLQLIEQYLQKK